MAKITLILGGAASGKSLYAENLATSYDHKTYIATAQFIDDELRDRIKKHQIRRGKNWQTQEVPLALAEQITNLAHKETTRESAVILIDCLTLWLTNLILAKLDIKTETDKLITALGQVNCDIILVSNEVGHDIVPENELARRFRDEQGQLNQTMAKTAADVIFIAAGLPIILKQSPK